MEPALSHTHYGRLAAVYRFLEYIAFGRQLQRSRECWLEQLADCDRVLIVGAGDGRVLPALLDACGHAQIESLELESEFIARARRAIATHPGAARVRFLQADVRRWTAPEGVYDGIVTQYVLDCFPEAELLRVVDTLSRALAARGRWIFTDFAIPDRPGFARWRARLTVRVLCAFFRWQAHHPLRGLPPMDAALRRAGLVEKARCEFCSGLVRATVQARAEKA